MKVIIRDNAKDGGLWAAHYIAAKIKEKAARTNAAARQNVGQLVDRIYAENLARIFKEQAKPTVEKVSAKEFAERAKA